MGVEIQFAGGRVWETRQWAGRSASPASLPPSLPWALSSPALPFSSPLPLVPTPDHTANLPGSPWQPRARSSSSGGSERVRVPSCYGRFPCASWSFLRSDKVRSKRPESSERERSECVSERSEGGGRSVDGKRGVVAVLPAPLDARRCSPLAVAVVDTHCSSVLKVEEKVGHRSSKSCTASLPRGLLSGSAGLKSVGDSTRGVGVCAVGPESNRFSASLDL